MRKAKLTFVAGLLLPAVSAAESTLAVRHETRAGREQARLCERLNLEEGARACRSALQLGIGPLRRRPVRQMLARHLVALERWQELADLLREDVRLEPSSAISWRRLGETLLYALDQRSEAIAALTEARRLAPLDANGAAALALALAADGRVGEAAALGREAQERDPHLLDERPAARAAFDAAERGESWP